MAKDDGLGEKTEPATPKRREEARKKGQVAQSKDLAGAVTMLVGFATLRWLGAYFGGTLVEYFAWPLQNLDAPIPSTTDAFIFADQAGYMVLGFLAPLLLVLFVVTFVVVAMQVGFKLAPEAFEFKPDKFDPIKGLGRIFSMRSLVKLLLGLFKIAVVGALLIMVLIWELPNVMAFIYYFDGINNNVGGIVVYLADMLCLLGIYAGSALVAIGVIDWAYQKWQHEEDLKMSKQEIKDEMKNMEGDPQIKRKRMEQARSMAFSRNMSQVEEADVVVTNPTHYSIAIRFNEHDPAPRVLAKGADNLALRIREIAMEHDVPIVEKPELARALYRWVEIDELIPHKYWKPVAEVLAYVYEMDKRKRERALGADGGMN